MDDSKQDSRATYETPVVRRIELKTDEVLVAGCKFSGASSGPNFANCQLTGLGGQCNADGS